MSKILAILILLINLSQAQASMENEDIDLAQMTRLKRNELFARKGYIFKSKELTHHFKKEAWYKAEKSFDEITVSKFESDFIRYLKAIEDYSTDLNDISKDILTEYVSSIKLPIDTTGFSEFTQLVNIDGQGPLDSITTQFFSTDSGVIATHSLIINDSILYSQKHFPAMVDLVEHEFLDYQSSSKHYDLWQAEKNSIALVYEFSNENSRHPNTLTSNYEVTGVSEDSLKQYLKNYKGSLLSLDANPGGNSVMFWYAPLNRLLEYYAP